MKRCLLIFCLLFNPFYHANAANYTVKKVYQTIVDEHHIITHHGLLTFCNSSSPSTYPILVIFYEPETAAGISFLSIYKERGLKRYLRLPGLGKIKTLESSKSPRKSSALPLENMFVSIVNLGMSDLIKFENKDTGSRTTLSISRPSSISA